MTNKAKTVIAIAIGLVLLSCLGIGGVYFFMYGYPALVNERFDTPEQMRDGLTTRQLMIGKVAHGEQFIKPREEENFGRPDRDFSRLATTYYHRLGPVGRVMETMNWFPGPENTYAADARMPASLIALLATPVDLPYTSLVGVWSEPPIAKVFLAEGGIASYARPYQFVDFYERNPEFIKLSVRPGGARPTFTYVQDAQKRGANIRILEGPERKTLADKGPRRFYKVIVADTIRGRTDLVSQDLMTREAMALFFEALTDDGILLIHTSNRNYNLVPPVADVAQNLGFSCVHALDQGRPNMAGIVPAVQQPKGHFTSEWVLVARVPNTLAVVEARRENLGPNQGIQWLPLKGSGKHVWSDDAGNSMWSLKR